MSTFLYIYNYIIIDDKIYINNNHYNISYL